MVDGRCVVSSRFEKRVILLVLLLFATSLFWLTPESFGDLPTCTTGTADQTKGLDIGDPISANAGAYHFTVPLLNLGGPLPLSYSLSYRMDQPSSRSLTDHFQSNTDITLELHWSKSRLFVYLRNGEFLTFLKDVNPGEWVIDDASSIRYVLKETGADECHGYYYLADPVRELVYIFQKMTDGCHPSTPTNAFSRIVYIMDRSGNRLDYGYDCSTSPFRPHQVSDGLGRTLNLIYSAGTEKVAQVTDQCGRTVLIDQGASVNSTTDATGNATQYHQVAPGGLNVQRPEGNIPYTILSAMLSLTNNWMVGPRVTSQTDAYGNTVHLAYNSTSPRVTETRPDCSTVQYEHHNVSDNNGPPKSLTDAMGHTATFAITTHEQISSITDRLGDTTTITYHDPTGKVSSYTDAERHTTTYTYTAEEQTFTNPDNNSETVTFTFYNLTQITHPDGTHEDFAYDNTNHNGNILTYTDRAGKVWRFTYNAHGQVLTVTNPTGGVITYTYNATDATLVTKRDNDTGTITYHHDTCKRLIRVDYPDGTNSRFTYNANDKITSYTDRKGVLYRYTYDKNGNLVSAERAAGTAVAQTTQYEYDLKDRLTKVIDPAGRETKFNHTWQGHSQTVFSDLTTMTFGYDPRLWINSVTDEAGKVWRIGYDDEGVVNSYRTPENRQVAITTNKIGQITRVTDPMGGSYRFQRDAMGKIVKVTNRLGRELDIGRDNVGRVTSLTLPVVGTVTYQRDGLGNIVKMTDQRGGEWSFEYTPMGRIKKFINPLGQEWSYTYNTAGRLFQITYPDGTTENRTYDGNGKLIQRQFSDGLTLTYTYDELNRLNSTASVPVQITYDNRDLVTNTNIHGGNFGATYDDRKRVKTLTYDGGMTVTYTYDSRGLVTEVKDNCSNSWVKFEYDNDGLPVRITRSNGQVTDLTRDANGRITKITHVGKGEIEYTFNAEDEIVQAVEHLPLDVASFLAAELKRYTYDPANQITSTGFIYDDRGRRIQDPQNTYTWNSADRLIALDHGANHVTYDYTALGELAEKTVNGQTTKYCHNYALPNHPVVAEKANGNYVRFYVWTPGGELLYHVDVSTAKPYFHHFNHQGSTLFLTDQNGSVTDSYGYTPYGKLVRHDGTSGQPFTFVGQKGVLQQDDTGIYHMGARCYDSMTGRFISHEPMWRKLLVDNPKNANPYQYAFQNPVENVTPTGLSPKADVGILAGLLKKLKAYRANNIGVMQKTLEKNGEKNGFGPEVSTLNTFCPETQVPKVPETCNLRQRVLARSLDTKIAKKVLERDSWLRELREEYFKTGYIIENGRVELYNPYEDGYNYAW